MNFKSSHAQNQRIEKITKEEAVRLSDEIGPKKAAEQLGVSYYVAGMEKAKNPARRRSAYRERTLLCICRYHAYISTIPGYGPDLRHAIVTHETGHALGVSHLDNSPAHTGSNNMNSGGTTKTLTTTDIQHAQI
ncbi:hypothetical protein [Paenibacillus sp. GCM10012303]|uniref:hypothetical protein n=1 Tax=Paenibacillus sp. GCM10012303 TaxID=3317340 RepID=UPI00360DC406